MMRERILAILLIISLCANVYLVFFNQSPLDGEAGGLFNLSVNPALAKYNMTGNPNATTSALTGRSTTTSTVVPTTVKTTVPTLTPTPKPTPVPTPPPWIDYSNSKYRFSLKYPREWDFTDNSKKSASPAVTITTPPELQCSSETTECYKFISTFTVDIVTNPETYVLEEYFNDAVSTLQKEYYITTTSKSSPTILSENKAYRIDFISRDERGNADKSYVQYYSIIDKKVYILTYSGPYSTQETVFDYYKRDAQEIIDSFTVDRVYKEV